MRDKIDYPRSIKPLKPNDLKKRRMHS